MAPAARKTTGTSRTRSRTGAAPAVSGKNPQNTTAESEQVIEVEPAAGDNTEAHDASDAPATDVPAPEGTPVTGTDGEDAPTAEDAAEDELVVGKDEAPTDGPPPRDLSVLASLADTSGRSAVTPYPGAPAPSPVRVLPPLRDAHVWTREGDEAATARVVLDGWRVRINGIPRFAGKGDRVTAPADVIDAGIRRGTLVAEQTEKE